MFRQLVITRPTGPESIADTATWQALTAVLDTIPGLTYRLADPDPDLMPGMVLLDYPGVRTIVTDDDTMPSRGLQILYHGQYQGADLAFTLPDDATALRHELEPLVPWREIATAHRLRLSPGTPVSALAGLQDYSRAGVKVRRRAAAPSLPTGSSGCETCDGRRWLRIDPDGDHTRAWIERCDDCAYFGAHDPRTLTDRDAALLAAWETGFWAGEGRYQRGCLNLAEHRGGRPHCCDSSAPYLIGADPDLTAAQLVKAPVPAWVQAERAPRARLASSAR